MALERELATYQAKLPELVADAGKFVVIHGDSVAGIYDTYADALKVAYKAYGVDGTFLVKKISPVEQVSFITRNVLACPV